MFRNEDAFHSGTFATANDRAEVMRVFDVVEQHEQRQRTERTENQIGIGIRRRLTPRFSRHERHDALMIRAPRHLVEQSPFTPLDGNA